MLILQDIELKQLYRCLCFMVIIEMLMNETE